MMMIIIIDITDTSVQQIRKINLCDKYWTKITTDIKKVGNWQLSLPAVLWQWTSLHTRKSESKTTFAEDYESLLFNFTL